MDKLRRFNNEETDKVNIYESTIIRMSNDSDHNIVFVVDWLEGDNIKSEGSGVPRSWSPAW